LDKCPHTPADVAVDKNGCPLDEDNDGVPDYLDKCPHTPAGVDVDKNGCPLDEDNDGVPDYLDKCPHTPADVAVDESGCPSDKDNDGVPDYLDRCPELPGVVSNNGCPELKAEVKKIFKQALHGIQFETGKSSIKSSSNRILNQIVQIMKDNPDFQLEIGGHTDSIGSLEMNMDLSDRRAAAVKAYLAKQGVEESRMTSQGFGSTQPVATNTTSAGRAENRRVEFTVIFER
jgi:outer membrane protein OmpA-like peptidoglycan-associated protein